MLTEYSRILSSRSSCVPDSHWSKLSNPGGGRSPQSVIRAPTAAAALAPRGARPVPRAAAPPGGAEALARYIRAVVDALAAQPLGEVMACELRWPEVDGG